MKIMFNGNEIGRIATNKSLTTEEALYLLGIDVNNQEDCQKAYEGGAEYVYLDDCGNYRIDTENIILEGDEQMKNIDIEKIKKVVFNDYSSYEEERSRNGGCYGFWDEYTRTPDGKWEVSHGTTADMDFCPCCGGFGECMCGGEYETITDDELENLIRNFQESEDEWIEITYMEG